MDLTPKITFSAREYSAASFLGKKNQSTKLSWLNVIKVALAQEKEGTRCTKFQEKCNNLTMGKLGPRGTSGTSGSRDLKTARFLPPLRSFGFR